jgi:2-C-methyl-D-erythritol 2,4-cyclodiphosphate synthase
VVLGGVDIPHNRCLSGDVLIHATIDALLGALALRDIGQMFPTTDPRWKNQPSTLYLDHTVDLLHQKGWQINNVDATIIAARPVMAPYIPAMRAHLALHLKVDIDDVSIKATTTDGLGFVGRAEGVGCHVIALVAK